MHLVNETFYNGNNALQGIIYNNFTPDIISSQEYKSCTECPISNIRQFSEGFWSSANLPNMWFIYDFSGRSYYSIEMTHYTLKQHIGIHFMTNWKIECSNDRNSWITLYTSKEGDEFTYSYQNKTFEVSQRKVCRYIRFYSTGTNEKGNNYVNIWAFEVFGKIYDMRNPGLIISNNKRIELPKSLLLVLIYFE